MRVYEAVLELLVASGVRLFAGMTGSTTAPYVAGLAQRSDARYIGVRHEQVAAAMLDASGRLTRSPGCLLVHGASGTLAASLGIAAAALDGTPMLVLSATQERTAMERGNWQALDVLNATKSYVKWQTRVERADRAIEAVREALREAVSGRPGVTQVDLPIDVSTDEVDVGPAAETIVHQVPLHRAWPDPRIIRDVRNLLAQARRPLLLIGGGAAYAGAGDALRALAEVLVAPVVVSPASRGLVAEDHPLSLGPSGVLGFPPIGHVIAEADILVAIGSPLSDLDLVAGQLAVRDTPIIQVDVHHESLGRHLRGVLGIPADALAFTESLLTVLREEPIQIPAERQAWVDKSAQRIHEWKETWFASAPGDGLVEPQEIVEALYELVPRDAILTHGAGDHGFYGSMVRVATPGTHLLSARLGAMGCALGLAMGAKLARPRQEIVACVGDGELMLQVGDLETLVREGLSITIVVFNNFRLGSQRGRVASYGPVAGVDHQNPDFARLAELFGARGVRIDRPGQFPEALQDALATDDATVFDIIIDPDARPPRINPGHYDTSHMLYR